MYYSKMAWAYLQANCLNYVVVFFRPLSTDCAPTLRAPCLPEARRLLGVPDQARDIWTARAPRCLNKLLLFCVPFLLTMLIYWPPFRCDPEDSRDPCCVTSICVLAVCEGMDARSVSVAAAVSTAEAFCCCFLRAFLAPSLISFVFVELSSDSFYWWSVWQ